MERFVIETKGNKQHWCEDEKVPELGEVMGKYIVQARQKINGVWYVSLDLLSDAGVKK